MTAKELELSKVINGNFLYMYFFQHRCLLVLSKLSELGLFPNIQTCMPSIPVYYYRDSLLLSQQINVPLN